MMKNKRLLQILIPIVILAVIGGLYLMKNNERQAAQARQEALTADNPAFRLIETSVDLEGYLSHKLPVIMDFGAEDCAPAGDETRAGESARAKHRPRGHQVL